MTTTIVPSRMFDALLSDDPEALNNYAQDMLTESLGQVRCGLGGHEDWRIPGSGCPRCKAVV